MKNIIITGGELFNKGAQAMVFAAVDEMKKRFPDHQIYVLSERDCRRSKAEKEIYSFNFMGWYPPKFAKAQHSCFMRILCLLRHNREFRECDRIYRNTDLMVDVSGYALGTIWSDNCNKLYLDNIFFAKEFNIPVYLMPQSFGPFDFPEQNRKEIDDRIRELLPYCKVICTREKDSYDLLTEKYKLKNVVLKNDLVLNHKETALSNIFRTDIKFDLPAIVRRSVAVIPNVQNTKIDTGNTMTELYCETIKFMLKNGYNVYLISHSAGDQFINDELKKLFPNEEKVHLLDREFSCLEFGELIKSFDFLIASRYHSIVHAYKDGIPCLVAGWASKYAALASLFGQQQYFFDVRNCIDKDAVIRAAEKLISCHEDESRRIRETLSGIQKENVFDIITKGD